MEQRVSVITLGVADLDRSHRFYEALGWRRANREAEVAFFQLPGAVLSLFSRESLAADAGLPAAGSGFGGIVLAFNGRSREEVDAVIGAAEKAGAAVLKRPEETFWGGYGGYFADPDGHPWEVAFNPFWTMDAEGRVTLPQPDGPPKD